MIFFQPFSFVSFFFFIFTKRNGIGGARWDCVNPWAVEGNLVDEFGKVFMSFGCELYAISQTLQNCQHLELALPLSHDCYDKNECDCR